MIYNSHRDFLFIHIQKTAGTAITRALQREQGSVFISPAHLLRKQIAFQHNASPHTFAVVRNPWERLVSWWRMMQRKGVHNEFSRYLMEKKANGQEVDFSTFIRRTSVVEESVYELEDSASFPYCNNLCYLEPRQYLKSLSFNQLDYLTDAQGTLRCSTILRFERLAEEWEVLYRRLLPYQQFEPLETVNSNGLSGADWRSLYSDSMDREWVSQLYQRDIVFFGFTFEGHR